MVDLACEGIKIDSGSTDIPINESDRVENAKKMWNGPDGKCPAEAYDDRESACQVMLGIFGTQEECARFHYCPERRCAIEGRWPEVGKRDHRKLIRVAAGFCGVAFDGPAIPPIRKLPSD